MQGRIAMDLHLAGHMGKLLTQIREKAIRQFLVYVIVSLA